MSRLFAWIRAGRGARALDRIKRNWYRGVDPAKLQMESDLDCILGKLYGEFLIGIQSLKDGGVNLSGDRTILLGFVDGEFSSYKALNRAWKGQIEKRLARYKKRRRVAA